MKYKIIVLILLNKYIGLVTVQDGFSSNANDSFYGLFENAEFPKAGELPMLNRKVFRGTRVSITEHPYLVSVRRFTAHYLTGTLLTKNLVITVAHPLHKVCTTELGIVAGENYADRGTSVLTVLLMIFHENFDPYTLAADIVLLRFYEDIIFRVSIKPISFASSINSLKGQAAFVTGWGRCDRTGKELCLPKSSRFYRREKLDPMLRSIKFTFTPSSHCQPYYVRELSIDDKHLCVGPAREDDILSPCLAVPGAPLVVGGQLVGIQSWGFGCGYTKDMPLVYTNLEAYLGWFVHNVPSLRGITQNNLSEIYFATKLDKVSDWLYETRFALSKTKPKNQDIQVLDIDNKLVKLKGVVYDVRDFIEHGQYHTSKMALYQNIKESAYKLEALKKVNNLRNSVDVVPFLTNDTLDDAGLVMRNGSLTDNESSEESDDEEIEDDYSTTSEVESVTSST